LFLTAIQTQGLLLQYVLFGGLPPSTPHCSDQLFRNGFHLQRDRHLRWH
jgi:hypothetical protein